MFILISILIFGLIIAIHELGHFLAAKLFGVGVPEFAIGMGPRIFKIQGKETLYSLRAIPVGGFCAMDGDDNEEQGEKSLFSKPLWQRLIIFLSGSLLNIVTAFLVLLIVHASLVAVPTREISAFAEGFPHQHEQGFQVGDSFHRIGPSRVFQNNNIGLLLDLEGGAPIDIVVIRDGQRVTIEGITLERQVFEEGQNPRYGFYFMVNHDPTFADRFAHTVNVTGDFIRQLPLTLRMFISGQAGMGDVSSVVGIVDLMNEAGQTAETAGLAALRLAVLAAIISISVAMVNLMPIPGLDGGRIFLMLVSAAFSKLFRREFPAKLENYVNTVGLILLFGFMIFIIFNDIVRIVQR